MHFVSCRDTVKTILHFLSNKESGMYLRYGDGDFNLARGIGDLFANPTESLEKAMNDTMALREKNILLAIPHHCKELDTIEEGIRPGNHEYPLSYVTKFLSILSNNNGIMPEKLYTNIALSYCGSKDPELVVQIHKILQQNPVIFLGNQNYTDDFLEKIFGKLQGKITTPERDAWSVHDTVMQEFEQIFTNRLFNLPYFVVVVAAGCAGRPFAGELYRKYLSKSNNFFIFDYGSLLDYLFGLNTRAYMNIDPPQRDYILSHISTRE
jgi:hypothetical protein